MVLTGKQGSYSEKILILIVAVMCILNVCLAAANYSTNTSDSKAEKEITVDFPGETRWVEVYEGSGGGSIFSDQVKIKISDGGYDDTPYVTVSDGSRVIRQFKMTDDEIAKVFIKKAPEGVIIRNITITDLHDNIFSKTQHYINNIVAAVAEFLCMVLSGPGC